MIEILVSSLVTLLGCVATYFLTITQIRQEIRSSEILDTIGEINAVHSAIVQIMAQGLTHTNDERMREARAVISRLSDISSRISHLKLPKKKKRNIEIAFVSFKRSATGVGTNFESANYKPLPISDPYFINMDDCKQKLNEFLRDARDVNLLGR